MMNDNKIRLTYDMTGLVPSLYTSVLIYNVLSPPKSLVFLLLLAMQGQ